MKLQWYIPLSAIYVTFLARYFEILRKNSTIHETADKIDDVRLRRAFECGYHLHEV